ncbi:transmembrane protein 255A isoform X4 [Numida meleagris]|uniref:transmembrane protein 255A isoform X4 n=1 Tax=Numida meleagris TaxID=8996 RepID=UPI000B3E3534|nr:transmembrane protein 255A isoform X4 [Numida meleagris]
MRQSLTQQRPGGIALPDSVAWFWVISWNNWIKLDRKQKTNAGCIDRLHQLWRHCCILLCHSRWCLCCETYRPAAAVCRTMPVLLQEHHATRVCHPQRRAPCTPKIKTNTCFCCDLYNCGKVEISGGYYEYIDVSSCQDIIHLYHLLWSATILNIVGLFLGIITAAILGGFKDMTPSLPTLNCTVENAHPTVSYYSRPQVTSYNTYYHSTPHLPPYSAYDFQHSSVFPASTPSGLSDDPQSVSPSPSYMWSSNAPPRYSPPYFPPFEKPPPYTP